LGSADKRKNMPYSWKFSTQVAATLVKTFLSCSLQLNSTHMATKKPSPYGSVKFKTIDEYHAAQTHEVQAALTQLRQVIHQAAPQAEETISYNMPCFKQGKNLVYYAAHSAHIGFYPSGSPLVVFAKELANYKTSKGAIQFPFGQPLPKTLIKKIVQHRVREEQAKAALKKSASAHVSSKLHTEIAAYHHALSAEDRSVADLLAATINSQLPKSESKIWHAHPVWFLDGNPIVGYSKLKNCMRLLFWSGQSFDEPGLHPEGKFKAAEVRYTKATEVKEKDLKRWLKKAVAIQWDYKHLVKRKGVLLRLK